MRKQTILPCDIIGYFSGYCSLRISTAVLYLAHEDIKLLLGGIVEFTKKEERILSPKHEKKVKRLLWLGIVCLCLSVSMIIWLVYVINHCKSDWDKNQLNISQSIEPATEQAAELKGMLLHSLADNKEMYATVVIERLLLNIMSAFLAGCFCIGYYLRSQTYIRLIRKLKNS
jgi:hypothetical protein